MAKKQNGQNWILAYYQAIKNGSVTVGRWIELLYDNIMSALEAKEFYFDQKKANDAVNWMEAHCFHTKGPLAPGPLRFELWQKAMISCIYGLVDETGMRQFSEILFVSGRKQGKSIVAASIAKYDWWIDGGYGAEVYTIAPKLEQANIIYGNVWKMVELDPEYKQLKANLDERDAHNKRIHSDEALPKKRASDLYIPETNSAMKKIAFNAKASDGFNPSLCICDEIASWEGDKGLKQYEVMRSGMGARPGAMMLSCTTAGYVDGGIYDELLTRATRFLLGNSKEKKLLPFLYMVDDPDKWNDINELRKSMPNLGGSVPVNFILDEIAVAEGSLSKKTEFLVKYCNVKQHSSLAWLPAVAVEKASGEHIDPASFANCYCVGGIDLSRTTDLTACTAVIQKNGELYVLAKFFLPSAKLEEAIARDGLPYDIYAQRGLLQLSGDNFVDYHDCEAWFRELVERWKIYPLQTGYDKYSAQYLIQSMEDYGFHCDDVFQGFNLTPVINEFDGLMRDGRIHIGDNDLLKIHLLNAALKRDVQTERVRLVKIQTTDHIDGTAALLDAMTVRQKYWSEIGMQLENSGR